MSSVIASDSFHCSRKENLNWNSEEEGGGGGKCPIGVDGGKQCCWGLGKCVGDWW